MDLDIASTNNMKSKKNQSNSTKPNKDGPPKQSSERRNSHGGHQEFSVT